MGLYDEEGPVEDEDEEPLGKVIKTVRKKSKPKSKKLSANREFEFPSWLKSVLLGVGILIVVVILGFVIYNTKLKPELLSSRLNSNPSYISNDSSSTKLVVDVQNIKDYDLKNLTLTIAPMDKMSIAIIPSGVKKINMLGSNEKREFVYDVSSIGNIIPGRYGINVTLDTGEEIVTKQVFWEIKNHK